MIYDYIASDNRVRDESREESLIDEIAGNYEDAALMFDPFGEDL